VSKTILSGFTRRRDLVEGDSSAWETREDPKGKYWIMNTEEAQAIRRKLEDSRIQKLLQIHERSKH